MKVSAEAWREVEPLLAEALEMDVAARERWLARVERDKPQASPMLRRLLANHQRAERSRELEAVPPTRIEWRSAHAAGEAIGPFVLLRVLGHGGMGEVWLARQADGRVEREVALKLPVLHRLDATWRERFRRERDILARLEHPHIARLYDAGVTGDGQPWLAMEFVAGSTLTAHAGAASASVPARLVLFRQVLAAVAHAHRHLVVHRDLKPANMLVDAAGQVKLLDFGIAKLLDETGDGGEAATELTRAGGRVMTPRYAAPEQVLGGSITTATDIYALGVVLHELLTGQSPYRAVREGRPLVEATMFEQATAPSAVARGIGRDLDAIVLKAMRREPAARYASVEQLDAEIAAVLEHRPVKARAGTWRYLAGRFALRHKLPLAAAAAVVVTLVAGLVVAERERRIAVAEKARAERHFASVRQLANAFVFDVDAEIEHLAGALKARQTLVATAARYLDSLAQESEGDPALAIEVASTYRRLAEISGDARVAHLGDPVGARRHATRADALLRAVEARDPANARALREHRLVLLLLGRLRLEGGDAAGDEDTARGAEVAERLAALPGATAADRRDLGATLAQWGGILAVVRADHEGAAARVRRAVELLEAQVAQDPADAASRAVLGYAYERASMAAEVTGEEGLQRALALLRKSIAATESAVRDEPRNVLHRQNLCNRYNSATRVQLRLGDAHGARADAAAARRIWDQLVAEDSRNVANLAGRVSILASAAHIERITGRYAEAVALAREAIAANANIPAEHRRGLVVRDTLATAQGTFVVAACALRTSPALIEEAVRTFAEFAAFKRELIERGIDASEAARELKEVEEKAAGCQGG